MKKFYIFTLVAAMFAACTSNMTDEQAVCIDIATPETLIGTFEGDEMRIQLDNGKTVWTADDLVSVFYLSNANQKWQYQGETGERTGNLKQVEAGSATETMKRVVVVYPYNENYYINTDTYNVKGWLPAEQTYLADSYGLNGNIMISQSEYNQFSLKNVCGWLKLQLTGNGEKVQTITLKGNNGEQVAGEIYINSADATASLAADMGSADDNDNSAGGNLVFEDTILTEVTLNCGDGVTLGAEPTAFYIGLPPQEFSKGLTVEVVCSDGSTMTKSTEKEVVIARNTILPMAVFEYIKPQPNNEIWYTSSDGKVVKPRRSDVFGANIVANTYENGKGVIKFDGNVTSIGYNAFYNCTSLTSVTIPNRVTSIGWAAFYSCTSLTSVTIPDSVTSIGSDAFYWCTSLTSVTIPDSVTSIGEDAFCGCTSLTSVTIPDSVTVIGDYAFRVCNSLTAFYGKFASEDNRCLVVNGVLNSFAHKGLTEYTIPDSVTSIGRHAFNSCSSLTSITIPNSVTSIGDEAFRYCTSLTSITIPDRVTSIRYTAFGNCTSLTSVTIPDSVTEIEDQAFYGCTSLTSVTIGDSVTEIGGSAFSGCTSLTSVTIPDSVTKIGHEAFSGCTSLASVTIGNSVTSIGDGAFVGCWSLTSVTIPNSVTSIGVAAFYGCTSLTSVYCKPTTPPSGDADMFSYNSYGYGYKPIGCKIYVPRASVSAYKAASYWSYYKSYIEPYDF